MIVASIISTALVIMTVVICYTVFLLNKTKVTRTELKLRRTKTHLEQKQAELETKIQEINKTVTTLKLQAKGNTFR